MKIKWTNSKKKSYWITQYVTTATWSGASTQASRTLEFSLVNSPYDKDMKRPDVKLGDQIRFYDDKGKLRFVGRVTSREKTGTIGTVNIVAKDYLHNLVSSTGSYKFKTKTPEYITRALCKDLGVSVGKLKKTGKKLSKFMPNDMSYYDMILKAYQLSAKGTSKKYMLRMNGAKLEVIAKGTIIKDFILKGTQHITRSSFSENIDAMVNTVTAYNSKNQKIGTVKNAGWIKKYGAYRKAMSVDDKKSGKKTSAAKRLTASDKKKAKAELHGSDKTATIEALGYISCISGKGVRIRDEASGLTSTYWIKTDSHRWENGVHTMTLDLEFKNVNESITYNKYTPQKKSSSSSSGSSSYSSTTKSSGSTKYSGGKFIWPVHGTITSEFGTVRSYERHPGMDIAVPSGTAVHAAAAGKVCLASWYGGYGNAVMIDHGGGLKSLYGHNSRLNVRVGQRVSQGQTVAHSGSTGRSTGPHCHFEVRRNGVAVNPRNYL